MEAFKRQPIPIAPQIRLEINRLRINGLKNDVVSYRARTMTPPGDIQMLSERYFSGQYTLRPEGGPS